MKIYLSIILLVLLSSPVQSDEFSETLELAEQGNAVAQYNIGDKRSAGSMVIKDASENEMWSITFCIQDPYETYLDTNLKFNNY